MKILNIYLLIGPLIFLSVSINAQDNTDVHKPSCCSVGKVCKMLGMSSMSLDNGMATMCQKSCAVSDYDPKDLVFPFEASVGDLTTCPVSGVVFRVTELSPTVNYKGKEIYTCCSSCSALYNNDPARFGNAFKYPGNSDHL